MNHITVSGRADLHTHTNASDGLLSPTQLIKYASQKGLKAVAVTDHDTTNGIDEANTAGKAYQVEVIPGIEINTQIDSYEIHILGYFINNESDNELQKVLSKIRDSRKIRAKKLVQNLVDLYDFPITYEEVLSQASGETVGRSHIARILVSNGVVKDVAEAFEKYLGTNCPAYVERYHLTPKEGINLIKGAGGVSVLAHPGLLPKRYLLDEILNLEIQGIEAYHSRHTQEQADYYSHLANSRGLMVTGGSDCHGELYNEMPTIGDISVGMEVVDALRRLT